MNRDIATFVIGWLLGFVLGSMVAFDFALYIFR